MKNEGGGDEIELSLELSIGGNYGKTEDSRYDKVHGPLNPDPLRSNVSENGCEYPQRRREIQALRRQEARKKREEKFKRSRAGNGEGFGEDGEIRAIEGFLEEPPRKKGVCSDEFTKESSPLSATESKIARHQMEQDCSYRDAQCVLAGNGFTHPFWVPNIGESKKNQGNVCSRLRDCDTEHANSPVKDQSNWRAESNRSLETSTSVVSDYQSTSMKGGSSSDTGSHVASRSTQEEQFDGNTSSQTEPCLKQLPDDNCAKQLDPSIVLQKSKASYCFNQTNNTCSPSSVSPTLQRRNSSESEKPIRPPVGCLSTTPLPHMPCVSATGNGPNGKTISGFLYKYTKTEVSIICVCHGNSFSPAEFVEHAGGVDISHPLRHITIVPSCF